MENSQNISNINMHYGPPKRLGVLDYVPNEIKKCNYYSDDVPKKFGVPLSRDVLELPKYDIDPKKKTPLIIKILGCTILVSSLALWGKSIGKFLLKFIKNFSK